MTTFTIVTDGMTFNAAYHQELVNAIQGLQLPSGVMFNGKISVTVASNNLTVALKNLAGNDPSSTDPVSININNTIISITSALSVTAAAGTNWCNLGGAEMATNESDLFVYIGYNATDGATIGFSRVPYGRQYSTFSATSTNETFCKISNITNAAATDYYHVIGRFAATLSAGAGYTWTVPTFTAINMIQFPVIYTRWLVWTPTIVGFSSNPSGGVYNYKIDGGIMYIVSQQGNPGTSNATNFTETLPLSPTAGTNVIWALGVDNNVTLTTPGRVAITVASPGLATAFKDTATGTWTSSSNKRISWSVFYAIS